MTLLALRPCDLTGFDPRQHFRRWLHRGNIFVAVRPIVELLAEFVSGPSTRVAACLCVSPQLRIECRLLIFRRRVVALLSPRDFNKLAVSNFNFGDRLGLETTRGALAHPWGFQERTLRA